MRSFLLICGALLCAGGVLIAAGMLKYRDSEKVVDLGAVEVEASREKSAPANLGYLLIGGGALLLVGGAVARRKA